jgi:hypothetical protein
LLCGAHQFDRIGQSAALAANDLELDPVGLRASWSVSTASAALRQPAVVAAPLEAFGGLAA